jgi:kynurenine formamidase
MRESTRRTRPRDRGPTNDGPLEIVDLTCPLSPATPAYPGDPAVTFLKTSTHSHDGYEVTHLCMGSHSGTHLDAPRHFFPAGATLDEYPMERLVGSGVIVDVRLRAGITRDRRSTSGRSSTGPGLEGSGPEGSGLGGSGLGGPGLVGPRLVEPGMLSEALRLSGAVPGHFLLLWTEGAYLSPDCARLLLDTGAGLVGTDGPSLDPPSSIWSGGPPGASETTAAPEPYAVHRLLLGNGVLLAERLCNLDRLGPGPVTCAFLPLAVIGTDGAPVRAIAWR